MNGGTLNVKNGEGFNIGVYGVGTVVQNGGTLTANEGGTAGNNLGNVWRIGWRSTSTGSYTLNGGTAIAKSNVYIGDSGTGTFTQNGGTMIAENGVTFAVAASSKTTFTLSGGVFNTKSINKGSGTLSGITFNGGTIAATNVTDGANFIKGLNNVKYGPGGLTLDTAGYNVTMATASGANVVASDASTFTKTGSGTLTVAAVPPVGNMAVSSGTLALSASCDNTAMLAHRWSFTGDLTDSVTGTAGGATASAGVTYSDGKASLTGGNKGTCYINLGANKLPSDSVTLEFWTTITTRKVWTKMFCLGKDSGNCLAFTFNRNSDSGVSGLDVSPNGGTYTGTGTLDANTPYYLAFTLKPNASGGTEIKGYCYNATTGALVGSFTQTLANWSLIDKIIQQSFCLGYSFWNDPDAYADYDEVRVWSGALSADAIALSATKGPDATAAEIAEIMAATSAASPALRTLTLESGATLSLGAGNTLVQPVVSGGGTVSGGTLKVANELRITDLNDCLIVDGGTLDIDGAKVVLDPAALRVRAAAGRMDCILVSAVNGGTITGSLLQPATNEGLPTGWRVKTTSSSVILRKGAMTIFIR